MGKGAGKGGCDGIEAGCEPAQAVLCCICFCLGCGPIMIAVGIVLLVQANNNTVVYQTSTVSTQCTRWTNTFNPSGMASFMAAEFQAVVSFPTCKQAYCNFQWLDGAAGVCPGNASRACSSSSQCSGPSGSCVCSDGTCDCLTTVIPLLGSADHIDAYGNAAFDSVPQYRFQGVLINSSVLPTFMLADQNCWPRVEIQQRNVSSGLWVAVALVSPKAGMAVWDVSNGGDCPYSVDENTDLAACNDRCSRLGGSLSIFNKKPFCYSGSSGNVIINSTCTKLKFGNNSMWEKDWVGGAPGCGCFYRRNKLQLMYPSARLIEQELLSTPMPHSPPPVDVSDYAPPSPPSPEPSMMPDPPSPSYPQNPPAPLLGRTSAFGITLRSGEDPWLVFLDVTNGTAAFDPGASNQTAGITLTVLGSTLCLLWCFVAYYSFKVWNVRGRYQYKPEGFVTGFSKRDVEVYNRIHYAQVPLDGDVPTAAPVPPTVVAATAINVGALATRDAGPPSFVSHRTAAAATPGGGQGAASNHFGNSGGGGGGTESVAATELTSLSRNGHDAH